MSQYKPYPAYKDSGVEWLGRVPEHWSRLPIKSLARPGSKTFTDGDWIEAPYITGEGIRLIQTGNIGEGKYKEQGYRYICDHTFAQFRCTEIEPGDILICRLAAPVGRSCLAPALGVRMITSVDNVILKTAQGKSAEYFVYLFTSLPYLAHVDSICRGGTRDRISRSMLGNIRVPEPPPDEQKRIATFLDRETARIDALIEKKQRLIELLKEKRQAVITQAVTKGLDPNVPMKDSGVAWLGDVPRHWKIGKLRWQGKLQGGLAKGRDLTGQHTIRLPYLRVANVQDGYLDLTDVKEIDLLATEVEGYLLKPGDVLMNEGGDNDKLGRGTVWDGRIDPCVHQNHVFAIRTTARLMPEWLALFTASSGAKSYFFLRSKQSTNLASISASNVKDVHISLPPPDEQRSICRSVMETNNRIEQLIDHTQRSADLLAEHRAALITAAVTGEIDVRDAA